IGGACGVLTNYVAEHEIQTEGGFLSIYLEGPPNRGANSADYITQIALSVTDRRQHDGGF
ncbi:MAG: hypothetical protein RR295_02855, partial [Oscillospiraceae bacterium]